MTTQKDASHLIDSSAKPSDKDAKKERLAKALRENLLRRKQAARKGDEGDA